MVGMAVPWGSADSATHRSRSRRRWSRSVAQRERWTRALRPLRTTAGTATGTRAAAARMAAAVAASTATTATITGGTLRLMARIAKGYRTGEVSGMKERRRDEVPTSGPFASRRQRGRLRAEALSEVTSTSGNRRPSRSRHRSPAWRARANSIRCPTLRRWRTPRATEPRCRDRMGRTQGDGIRPSSDGPRRCRRRSCSGIRRAARSTA